MSGRQGGCNCEGLDEDLHDVSTMPPVGDFNPVYRHESEQQQSILLFVIASEQLPWPSDDEIVTRDSQFIHGGVQCLLGVVDCAVDDEIHHVNIEQGEMILHHEAKKAQHSYDILVLKVATGRSIARGLGGRRNRSSFHKSA
jgi:hypothetical protein